MDSSTVVVLSHEAWGAQPIPPFDVSSRLQERCFENGDNSSAKVYHSPLTRPPCASVLCYLRYATLCHHPMLPCAMQFSSSSSTSASTNGGLLRRQSIKRLSIGASMGQRCCRVLAMRRHNFALNYEGVDVIVGHHERRVRRS